MAASVPAPTLPQAQLGIGRVRHQRLRPVGHGFDYPTWFLLLPMRTLRRHPNPSLRRNRRGWVSFHDADHGDGRADCLAWLDERLQSEGISDATYLGLRDDLHVLGHLVLDLLFHDLVVLLVVAGVAVAQIAARFGLLCAHTVTQTDTSREQ